MVYLNERPLYPPAVSLFPLDSSSLKLSGFICDLIMKQALSLKAKDID